MGGLFHLVQRGGSWTGCTNGPLLCGFSVAIKELNPRRKSGGFTRWRCLCLSVRPFVCLSPTLSCRALADWRVHAAADGGARPQRCKDNRTTADDVSSPLTSALVTSSPSSCRTTVGDRAFFVAEPRVWNTLPSSVTASEALGIFKRRLKTHLFGHVIILTFSHLRSPHFILLFHL